MTTTRNLLAATVLLVSGAALAQTTPPTPPVAPTNPTAEDIQHNVNQQNRIDQGLKSGQLDTKEAAQLEHQEAHVDKMEQRDLAKGPMTAQEQANLNAAQKKASQDIHTDRHNSVAGDPNTASSQRMQADVQRNANQQQHIEDGVQGGGVTTKEASNLERGQANVNHSEAHNGADGNLTAQNQKNVGSRVQNQSNHVYNARHNGNRAPNGN